ncbi:hypothetical protein, partial [Pseudomonas sp. PA-3-10C]
QFFQHIQAAKTCANDDGVEIFCCYHSISPRYEQPAPGIPESTCRQRTRIEALIDPGSVKNCSMDFWFMGLQCGLMGFAKQAVQINDCQIRAVGHVPPPELTKNRERIWF